MTVYYCRSDLITLMFNICMQKNGYIMDKHLISPQRVVHRELINPDMSLFVSCSLVPRILLPCCLSPDTLLYWDPFYRIFTR